MRVAYTLEQCWHRVPGGTAVAALEVATALAARGDVELVGVAGRHRHAPPEAFRPPVAVRSLPLHGAALYEAWLRTGHPHVEAATGSVDLTHATTLLVPPTKAPLVVTVHDLAFVHEPAHFTARGNRLFAANLELVRRRAALVLCSSLATLEDCAAHGVPAHRLRHVPLGVHVTPATTEAVADARRRYALPGPYLAFTGTLEPRKNLAGLLAALTLMDTQHDLVLIGPAGWGEGVVPPPALTGRVRLLGFVPEADKRALLAGADAFCYPSLREGFGLPVLEAMAQGTPVVTSRGTSTEEVAGGAAVLVDPREPADIARGIETALAGREALAARGRARAGEMTWEATAARTVAAYAEVCA